MLGKYSDGDGLLFRVTRGGTRDWFLKVQYKGKRKEYALGKYPELGLSDARAKAREWRSLIKAGIDPRNPTNVPSFRSCAEAHISTKLKNSSRKTRHQWQSTLETWVYPFIGNRDVDKVLRKDIEDLLLQRVPGGTLWENKHVTADRVRGRIDAILQRAVNHDLAPKNVALGIKDDLPKVMHQPRHHPSMPFAQINEFLAYLRLSSRANLLTKLAIEFGVLMNHKLAEWNKTRVEKGLSEIQHRIGIHYGKCVVGNMGSEQRLEFAVIGDAVNVASRICDACKNFDTNFLISADVASRITHDVPSEDAPNVGIRGREGNIDLVKIYTERLGA